MIGERADPHAWITPDIKFESSLFFTDNITSQKALLFPVRRLIQELTLFLTTRQLWTDSFTLTLSYRNKKQADIQVNLAQPDNDEVLFLRLFQTRLESGLSSKETDQVSLKARHFYPADPDNRSLFDETLLDSNSWAGGDLEEDPTQDQSSKHSGSRASNITKEPIKVSKEANNLISLLRSKLGDHACYGLSIEDDHRPEKSWNKTTQTRANTSQDGTITQRPNHRAQKGVDLLPRAMRPLFLLPQPRRLSRQYIPSEHPAFRYLRGPERISFGWWEGLKKTETITSISIKTDPFIGYSIDRSIIAGIFMASSLNPRLLQPPMQSLGLTKVYLGFLGFACLNQIRLAEFNSSE